MQAEVSKLVSPILALSNELSIFISSSVGSLSSPSINVSCSVPIFLLPFSFSKTGFGSFILKMDPGARSTPHTHIGYEEFLVIEGELIDVDNTVFKKGDFVTFEPGSNHSSYTEKGALLMVFQRGINIPIK